MNPIEPTSPDSDRLTACISVALAAIVYFGIGQTVDYLARTAFATDRLSTILETAITQRLESIESRLSPSTPLLVRVDATPLPPNGMENFWP